MEYDDIVKKLNELVKKIKNADKHEDIEPNIEIEDENMDYTEQFLLTEELTKSKNNDVEVLKEEFDKIIEDTLKKLEDEKRKVSKEIEYKLSNIEDYNEIYLLGNLQEKFNTIDSQINGINEIKGELDTPSKKSGEKTEISNKEANKEQIEEIKRKIIDIEISNKEANKEQIEEIKRKIIDIEISKLRKRKEEIEEEIASNSDENDYMAQYMFGNLQAELHEIDKQISVLESGNFTKQLIDRAVTEISELKQEKSKLEAKINSIDENDLNGIYLSGEQQYRINEINEINERLKILSVFNEDTYSLKEEQDDEKKEHKSKQTSEITSSFTKNENEGSTLQLIKSITCTIMDGRVKYILKGLNDKGKLESYISEIGDNSPIRQDEEDFLRKKYGLSDFDIKNIDPAIISILGIKTGLFQQYIKNITNIIDGNENDINIMYDLEKISDAKKETPKDKIRQLKKIAKINSKNGIAEYIKPKSRIKAFFEKLTRKALNSASKQHENEDETVEMLRQLSTEDGFDINQFYKDIERICEKLTSKRKEELNKIYSTNQAKVFREGFRVPKVLERISQKALNITNTKEEKEKHGMKEEQNEK